MRETQSEQVHRDKQEKESHPYICQGAGNRPRKAADSCQATLSLSQQEVQWNINHFQLHLTSHSAAVARPVPVFPGIGGMLRNNQDGYFVAIL